jgi:hypothetical protein
MQFGGLNTLIRWFQGDTYNYCNLAEIAAWTKSITDEYPNQHCRRDLDAKVMQMAYWQKIVKSGYRITT